jgi:hypothetical protein
MSRKGTGGNNRKTSKADDLKNNSGSVTSTAPSSSFQVFLCAGAGCSNPSCLCNGRRKPAVVISASGSEIGLGAKSHASQQAAMFNPICVMKRSGKSFFLFEKCDWLVLNLK